MFKPNPAFLLVEKLKSAPKGFTLGPKAEKRIPSNLGVQSATLGANVPSLISNLGSICNPKMLKVGPKFFGP
jgi:hypothetical protein